MILKKEELINIVGGAAISGTLINAFIRAASVALEIGRALGTAINMAINHKKC